MKYKLLILPIAIMLNFPNATFAEGENAHQSLFIEDVLQKSHDNETSELNLEFVARNGFVEKLRVLRRF